MSLWSALVVSLPVAEPHDWLLEGRFTRGQPGHAQAAGLFELPAGDRSRPQFPAGSDTDAAYASAKSSWRIKFAFQATYRGIG